MSYRTHDESIVNHARAIRIAEIMNDFRDLQRQIAQFHVEPTREEADLGGFRILGYAISQARAVLAQPFAANLPPPGSDVERAREQLRQYAAF